MARIRDRVREAVGIERMASRESMKEGLLEELKVRPPLLLPRLLGLAR